MNTFMNGLKNATNFTHTENGALTHKTTESGLLDLFAMGGAYRKRPDVDVINLFKKAFEENEVYALKCLFYLRDARGGQGERRFFRVAMKWLADCKTEAARRNLKHIPLYGRWDDLYLFVGTPLEKEMFAFMKEQLALDVQCKTPSLLAKWLKSENTSSAESRILANKTRAAFNMTHKQYRKTLSILRERINVLERLMSAGQWDKIEFDKIPSRAGMIYKNAFARHDIERMKANKEVKSYADFAKDTTTKVNAKALYPYECVAEALKCRRFDLEDPQRLMTNKYWDNIEDVIKGATFNGIVVADTSGSMTGSNADAPINVAISLALYCAERCSGPYAGHYISFASRPQLIKTEGVDFVDKVNRIYKTNLVDSTNIEATFDLLLDVAITNKLPQDQIPQNVLIISDMEFDMARRTGGYWNNCPQKGTETLMEGIEKKWNRYGYKMPQLVFWNVDARQNNIPMTMKNGISFVSGMSPTIFKQILSGKTAMDLILDVLNSERYAAVK